MNEIKFRGKRIDNGKWIFGYYLYNPFISSHLICESIDFLPEDNGEIPNGINFNEIMHDVIPETVGQFTGLKDKDGKEIYEGDIFILSNPEPETYYPLFIEYRNDHAAFMTIWGKQDNDPDWLYSLNLTEYFIIGNIHDNSELLT